MTTHDRCVDPVFVGVDADDATDKFCKRVVGASHGAEIDGQGRSGKELRRQNLDGPHRHAVGRPLIRSAQQAMAGIGDQAEMSL